MFNPTPRNYYGNARYDTDGAAHDNAADAVTNAAAATPNLDGESGTVLSWIPDRPAPSDPTVFGQAHYVPNSVLPKHVEPHIAAHFRALWVKLCGSVWELFQCASNADTPVARARYAELLRNLRLKSSDARDYVVIEAKAFGDRDNSRFACPVSTIPRLNSRVIVAHDRGVDNMLVTATPSCGGVRDRPPYERKAIADLLRKGQVVLGPVTPVDQRHRDKLLGLSTPLARLLEDAFDLLSSAELHSFVNVDSVVIRPDMEKAVVYVRCPEMVQVNTLAVAANWLLGCRVWIRQTRERGLRVGPVLDENWLSVDALIGIRLNGDTNAPPTKSDGDDSTTATTTTGDVSAATSASTTPPPSAQQQQHGWGNFVVAASTQAHPHPSYPSFRRAAHS